MSMSFLFDRQVWLLAEYVKRLTGNRQIEIYRERKREIGRERHVLLMKGIVF